QLAGEYGAQAGGCPGDRCNTVCHPGFIVRFGHDGDAPELARRLVPALALRPGGGPAAGPARAGARSTGWLRMDRPGAVLYYGADAAVRAGDPLPFEFSRDQR